MIARLFSFDNSTTWPLFRDKRRKSTADIPLSSEASRSLRIFSGLYLSLLKVTSQLRGSLSLVLFFIYCVTALPLPLLSSPKTAQFIFWPWVVSPYPSPPPCNSSLLRKGRRVTWTSGSDLAVNESVAVFHESTGRVISQPETNKQTNKRENCGQKIKSRTTTWHNDTTQHNTI